MKQALRVKYFFIDIPCYTFNTITKFINMMRYLAININSKLDQEWFYRCHSVLECYNYFDRLGPGHGPRAAIFDVVMNNFLWVAEAQLDNMVQLNAIVFGAIKDSKVRN